MEYTATNCLSATATTATAASLLTLHILPTGWNVGLECVSHVTVVHIVLPVELIGHSWQRSDVLLLAVLPTSQEDLHVRRTARNDADEPPLISGRANNVLLA